MDHRGLALELLRDGSAEDALEVLEGVLASGFGSAADRQRSEVAGVDAHLVKPVDPAVLVGVLRRFARPRAAANRSRIEFSP